MLKQLNCGYRKGELPKSAEITADKTFQMFYIRQSEHKDTFTTFQFCVRLPKVRFTSELEVRGPIVKSCSVQQRTHWLKLSRQN